MLTRTASRRGRASVKRPARGSLRTLPCTAKDRRGRIVPRRGFRLPDGESPEGAWLPSRAEIEHVSHRLELLCRQGAPEIEDGHALAVALGPGGIDLLVLGPAGADDQEVGVT